MADAGYTPLAPAIRQAALPSAMIQAEIDAIESQRPEGYYDDDKIKGRHDFDLRCDGQCENRIQTAQADIREWKRLQAEYRAGFATDARIQQLRRERAASLRLELGKSVKGEQLKKWQQNERKRRQRERDAMYKEEDECKVPETPTKKSKTRTPPRSRAPSKKKKSKFVVSDDDEGSEYKPSDNDDDDDSDSGDEKNELEEPDLS
jgi:hypothetical protein